MVKEKIINFFKGILSENGVISSNRFTLFTITLCMVVLLLSISFNIIWNTVNEKNIQFTEIGYFLAGSGVYIGAVLLGKVSQKKIENVLDKPTKID